MTLKQQIQKFWILTASLALLLFAMLPNRAYALGLGLDAGLFLGLGTRGAEQSAVEPEVWTVGGYVNGGFKIIPWIQAGVYFEYHSTEQRDAASEVNNLNFSGSGYLIGPSLAFKFGPLALIGAYSLVGNYEFDATTAAGLKSELSDPEGLHVILGVEVIPMLSIDAAYASVKYGEQQLGNVAAGLGSNRATYDSFRIGFSVHF